MRLSALAGVAVLAGCSPEGLAQTIYPGAQSFTYRSEAAETANTYVCAPEGPGGKTPEARAKATHRFVEREVMQFAAQQAALMMAAADEGEGAAKLFDRAFIAAGDAFGEKLFTDTDRQFKCFMVQSIDL